MCAEGVQDGAQGDRCPARCDTPCQACRERREAARAAELAEALLDVQRSWASMWGIW